MKKKNCFIFLTLTIIVFTFYCEPLLSLASTLTTCDTSIADTTLENMTISGNTLQDTTIPDNTLQDTTVSDNTLGDPTINIDDSLPNDSSAVSTFADNESLSGNEVALAIATTFTSNVPTAEDFKVGDILHEGDTLACLQGKLSVFIDYRESEDPDKYSLFSNQGPNVKVRAYTDFLYYRGDHKPDIPQSKKITGWRIFKITDTPQMDKISVCPVWEDGYVITYIAPDFYVNPVEWVFLPNENIIEYLSSKVSSKTASSKCIGWKNSDGTFYDFDNGVCPATKVDTFTLQTMALAPVSSSGTVPAGECYVERISEHKLDASSYKVNNGEDGCVYSGGIIFYVPESGVYTFTAQ